MGTSIGTAAATLPLTFAASLLIARIIEDALNTISKGPDRSGKCFGALKSADYSENSISRSVTSYYFWPYNRYNQYYRFFCNGRNSGGGGLGGLACDMAIKGMTLLYLFHCYYPDSYGAMRADVRGLFNGIFKEIRQDTHMMKLLMLCFFSFI